MRKYVEKQVDQPEWEKSRQIPRISMKEYILPLINGMNMSQVPERSHALPCVKEIKFGNKVFPHCLKIDLTHPNEISI
jgi:hypothetical protein